MEITDITPGHHYKSKVWFITGCLAGMGRHLAEAVLARGDKAVITARDITKFASLPERYPEQTLVLQLDVTHSHKIPDIVAQALIRFGQIDVLVNNAGYGLQGALEEITMEQLRRQFDTNFFGMVEVTKNILPHMREAGKGHIINISSIAGGLVATPKLGAYHATKFAVEGLSEALAQEVSPLGIKVTVVEMGAQHTDWWGNSLIRTENIIEDYIHTSNQHFSDSGTTRLLSDPKATAETIMQIVDIPSPPLHLVLGKDALLKVRQKLNAFQKEITDWEDISQTTSFKENQV
ncbi:SDR family NAD(P)-dependent oxidoreductase [Rhodocytophaga rosea]|uniref:SDR family NAD(P)-dependent oxidoreductase n=2 Tax=Rhodocytophaga rosea TaxID=2704465 RepID=A0A6C0GW33_9BACT|nr:SDR family NAD(P)-dependent oxidoreductase [Rhodocytophaga rosea]